MFLFLIDLSDVENEHVYRTIIVDITKFAGRKPYLGGFRHKKTQQIFHHASSQVRYPVP